MATKISNIDNAITGLELKNSANEGYFVVDIEDEQTHEISRNELINFIILRARQQNLLGDVITKNVGDDANEIPYFIMNNTPGGIVKHIASGGLITETTKSAFNKDFSASGVGNNGTQQIVARADHSHAELSAISLTNNTHTAVFYVEGESSYPITESMLLAKMKYTPTYKINPAINFIVYQIQDNNLIPVGNSDLGEQVIMTTYNTTSSYIYKKFSSITFPLNSSKSYAIHINFVDDNGLEIPVTSGQ